jgi:hypothetical protein
MGELWIAGSTPPAVIRPEQSRGCHVGVHFPTGTGYVDLSRERRGFFLGGSRDLLFADVVKTFEDTGLIAFN